MKKKLHLLTAFAFIATLVSAQVTTNSEAIIVTPANASGDDSITITFDLTKACKVGDKFITADDNTVMMHSSAHTTYPLADWGDYNVDFDAVPKDSINHPTTALTKNTNGTWFIKMLPRTFYGVPEVTAITGLSIVFNVGSWDREGKAINEAGDGCANFKVEFSPATAINHLSSSSDFTVYPNPLVGNDLTVRSSKNIVRLKISDVLGKEILTVNGNSAELKLSIARLQKGLYILSVYDVNGFAGSQKIIK